MRTHAHDPAAWLLPLILVSVGAPWLAGIILAWRQRARDGAVPPSLGERMRQRLVR